MTKERILKIKEIKEAASRRQWDNFNSTGRSKFEYQAKKYEEIVDLCEMALECLELRKTLEDLRHKYRI